MKNKLAIYGAGGFGREIMPMVSSGANLLNSRFEKVKIKKSFFVETSPTRLSVNGFELISEKSLIELRQRGIFFSIAIADSSIREEISQRMIREQFEPCSIFDRTSIFHSSSVIGTGAILSHLAIVTANTQIGKFFHGNYRSYVAHDCILGDFVTFAPGASCNGNVQIEDHVYVGANATIKEGTSQHPVHIGKNALIGMGAVVIGDVPENTIVVGNPARVIGMNNR
jgi:hypothetical protein